VKRGLTLLVFSATFALAQSEKITIRMVPEPNQTIRMNMTQEMQMDIVMEAIPGLPPGAAMPPMKMVSKTVTAMTQKVGPANAQGNVESEVIYDEIRTETTMNGQRVPSNVNTPFVGKRMTVTYDKEGNVVDFKLPPDAGLPPESLRDMLKSISANLPALSLAVGETANVPLDFVVPIPVPSAAPLKVDGQITHKLLSVETGADGRLGRFEHTLDGKMLNTVEFAVPTGNVKMTIDFTMSGGGSMLVNVVKGVLRSSESNATFGGKISMAPGAAPAPMPPMTLQGTIKTTITGTN